MSIQRVLGKFARYVVLPLFLLCGTVLVAFLSYRAYVQHEVEKATRITAPNGVESLEQVTLGGVDQWILIRGEDRSNPILLYLHGGPGNGAIALARAFHRELPKHFITVHWDQRGAGKSYSPDIPTDSMNIQQFVADTRELADILRARFNVPKIFLVGHSWGSMLGALTASRYPELFYAFVGVALDVDGVEGEQLCYQFVLDRAAELGDEEALRELREIGPPPYEDFTEMFRQRRWLEAFGGVNRTDLGNLWWKGATSPDISVLDGWRYDRGQIFSAELTWNEVYRASLFRDAPRIDVPVYLFLGRYDFNTPSDIAKRYYERLEAPRGKQIIWFENSAHMIPFEEPQKYTDVLVRKVLKESLRD
jgi:pimeloyl-ACP methyl ester carboxylesterase